MPRVVTVTMNPAVDKSIHVPRVVPERKLRSDRPTYEPGGGGINVARALGELGVRARAMWTCGGATGARLAQLLHEHGVDHEPHAIAGDTREHLIVFETSTGYQYRFGTPGPALSTAELTTLERRVADLRQVDFLVLSGSLPDGVPDDAYARLVRAAPEGCKVVLDTSGAALAPALAGGGVYLMKPNVQELGELSGHELEGDADIRDVARGLISRGGVQVIVTSLGGAGAAATTADEHWHVRAPTVPVRSAVGAGDSMVAGIVAALQANRPIGDAIRFGVAAGAAAVKAEGTRLCRREDVLRLDAELAAG